MRRKQRAFLIFLILFMIVMFMIVFDVMSGNPDYVNNPSFAVLAMFFLLLFPIGLVGKDLW